MLVTFSVRNFRSFDDEQTLSMVASKKFAGKHENHLVPIPGTDDFVLRTSVIYGANGAGKSNLFKALDFFKAIAIRTREKGKKLGRNPFRLRSEGEGESSFDLQFIEGEQLYRYGLVLDDEKIIEEWLMKVTGKRETIIFERFTSDKGVVTVKGGRKTKMGAKLEALMTVGGPKEQSFLATLRANLEKTELTEPIRATLNWFTHRVNLIYPESNFWPLGHTLSQDSTFREFAGEFMKVASIGIEDLKVTKKEITEEDLKLMLPNDIFQKVLGQAKVAGEVVIVAVAEDREVIIEKAGEHHFYLLSIHAEHKAAAEPSAVLFDFADESDGTRRLLNLLPALHRLHSDGGVFVIDEVERSMHPLLIYKFVEFFLSACAGEQRQMIVTTHESNLLDQELLRRDEIWFAEKNECGATQLYPLSDFQPRNDLKLDKHYFQGRFGAIPFLGELDTLMARQAEH